jgi:hypothetical protein
MDEQTTTTETTAAVPEPSLEELAATLFKADEPVAEGTAPAEPSEPSDKPAEVAPEPAAEKPQERVAKRIAAAARIEARNAQERAELRAQREAIEKANAELEAKLARYKILEEDPVKAFEELRIDPKTFLERLAGEQAPDNVLAKKLATLEAELKAEREARIRETETVKQRAAREAAEATWREASQTFVQFVGESAEKYPHLTAEFTEAEAVAEAERSLMEIVELEDGRRMPRTEAYFLQFGEYPDNDVIAEHLDKLAQARVQAREQSAWRKRGQSAPNGSEPLQNGEPNAAAPQVNRGTSPRTLTSRAASEKATAPKQKTQEEIDAESIRILQGAIKTG